KPVYECKSLTSDKISRTRYEFTASAIAENGAEVVGYTFNFGDGSTETTTNRVIEHEYAQPGTYTTTVTVNFLVDGKNETRSGAHCKVTVKVEEEPKQPIYKCESLTSNKINRTTFE